MKNKAILFGMIFMLAMLSMNAASAIVPNRAPYAGGLAYGWAGYGSAPVNPQLSGRYFSYSTNAVREGGFYGANSAYLIGLKAGVFDGPIMTTRTRMWTSGRYYPRVGGYFGNYYYNIRPGTFVYSGIGTNYASAMPLYNGPL